MTTLDKIKELQEQGMQEPEIIQKLTEQGLSPLEIQQALEQSKIKSAVSMPEEMQPSLMAQEQPAEETTGQYQQEAYPQYPTTQEVYSQYPQYQYPQYQEYQPQTDTISEISEQIAEEKIQALKKELSKISDFKNQTGKKIEDIESRLKRIENMIDKLQTSILGKIGNYSSNLEEIKQEMGMMQDSFSKALNPLIDKARQSSSSQQARKQESSRKQKKEQTFEDLLGR